MTNLFAAGRAVLTNEEKIKNMARLGQTLCQIQKTYLNQRLEQFLSDHAGFSTLKPLEIAQFVAEQRQGMGWMQNCRYESTA